jgi:hypothetical protein
VGRVVVPVHVADLQFDFDDGGLERHGCLGWWEWAAILGRCGMPCRGHRQPAKLRQ